jgi:uncharacterized protein YdaU (DUF1376 family)
MSLPYFRLYPTDYEAKTAHLNLLEDGAYFRLLRLCWMTPRCSLPDDEAWIMRRVRAHTDEEKEAVRFVLSEYFRRENQRVYSNRLMQEFEHAQSRHDAARENGMKGGRKTKALKTKETEQSGRLAEKKQTGKLKKANQNQNQNHNNPPTPQGDDGFNLFWQEVPRKVNKGQAVKAYRAALKKVDAETIRQGMIAYSASVAGKDAQYIAHPSSWLSGERWADETAPAKARTWREKPPEEWTDKDRTQWAQAML